MGESKEIGRILRVQAASTAASTAAKEAGVSFAEELVEAMIARYTNRGDTVLDPFAGFGTTLCVAERMGRRPLGVELLADRVADIRDRLADPAGVVEGNALQLPELGLPDVDFALTSPPYMNRVAHPQNPLTGYLTDDSDYNRYLAELSQVWRGVASLLRPKSHMVISAANIRTGDTVTTLAWDIVATMDAPFRFVREIVVDAPDAPSWLTCDYCLVFQRL